MAKNSVYDDIIGKLRGRIWIYGLISFAIFCLVFEYAAKLIELLGSELLPEGASLITLSPAEFFILKMKIAGYASISVIFLIAIIHIWRIVRSRTLLPEIGIGRLIGVFLFSIILFALGTIYSLELMLPLVLEYLHGDTVDAGLSTTYSLSSFYHFIFLLTFSLGLGFQLPLVIVLMLKLELTDIEQLTKYRRHLIVAFFVIAAIITPPDVISQFLLAIPLMILYEISILVGKFS